MANLGDIKTALRVTHDDDDGLLQRLFDSAVREAVHYIYGEIDANVLAQPLVDDVFNGIVLLVQQDYEGEPAQREQIRRVAQTLWNPYRVTPLGV